MCGEKSENDDGVTFQPDYLRLQEVDASDLVVGCLPAAMFLFAIEKVRSCYQYEFEDMCRQYVSHWRKRLDPQAWGIVEQRIKEGLKEK